MSKLLKSWKILSFGLLSVALGLMLASCAETDDGPTDATVADGPYYVTVVGGVLVDGEGEEIGANTEYDSRDPVYIYANAKPDSLFFKWTSSSGVSFYSDTLQLTSFVMLSKDVTVTATYIAKPDPSAVRFTWEKAAQSKIQSIAASKSDYQSWFEDVYMAESYIEEDATDVPLYSGSDQLPNNIYSSTLHAKSGSPYKSRYFSISEGDDDGKYTAVCTVDDPAFDNIADIVANYDVSVTGDNVFFEVAFDVDTFLEGEDDIGWFPESRDNPYSDPRLEKAKAKKLVKKVQKNNVTYYILHRPRK